MKQLWNIYVRQSSNKKDIYSQAKQPSHDEVAAAEEQEACNSVQKGKMRLII